jgi:histidine triad (HIT) family protein
MYQKDNIFAKIIRGEIPAKKICENDNALSFYDIHPQAKIHVLVIPKGEYTNLQDFTTNASVEEILDFFDLLNATATALALNKEGFRTISNSGANGGQEVPHFHMHLLGGESLGKMVGK